MTRSVQDVMSMLPRMMMMYMNAHLAAGRHRDRDRDRDRDIDTDTPTHMQTHTHTHSFGVWCVSRARKCSTKLNTRLFEFVTPWLYITGS